MKATRSTIAAEVRKIIENDGFPVVFLHKHHEYPCSVCLKDEPTPQCPKCLGTGFKVSLRVIKIRDSFRRFADHDMMTGSPIGKIGEDQKLIYCLPSVRPITAGDYIFEVLWDASKKPAPGNILDVTAVYEVNQVEAQRGEGGDLSFYRVGVQRQKIASWLSKVVIATR